MNELFKIITDVIINILNLFTKSVEFLINNPFFQIIIAIIILGLIINLIFKIVKGYKMIDHSMGDNFSKKTRRYYVTKLYINNEINKIKDKIL